MEISASGVISLSAAAPLFHDFLVKTIWMLIFSRHQESIETSLQNEEYRHPVGCFVLGLPICSGCRN
jgi:hypothetical protein